MSPAIGPLDLSGKLSIPNAMAGILVAQSAFAGGTFMDGVEAIDCYNCVALAPRGSKTAQDWLRDADFEMEDTNMGKVHKGFWTGAQALLGPVTARLSALGASSTKPVICFGHSLGGAEIKLLAMLLPFPATTVITFGCPRVGDSDWARIYNAKYGKVTWDFVNGSDVVPRVPPRFPFGFRLTEQRVFLPNGQTNYELNPPWGELVKSFFAGLWFQFRAGKLADGLADPANAHHLENYAARLKTIVQ